MTRQGKNQRHREGGGAQDGERIKVPPSSRPLVLEVLRLGVRLGV